MPGKWEVLFRRVNGVVWKESNECKIKCKYQLGLEIKVIVYYVQPSAAITQCNISLQQLERLRSEDTHRLMITHTIESYWILSQKKTSQSYKFKNFAKISNLLILKKALHATHLLKLLDKMCKYEMDPMSIIEVTERPWFCPQTDRRTRWYQYTPLSISLKRGV